MRLLTHTVSSVQSSRMTALGRAFYRLSFFNCRQTAQIATVFTPFSCRLVPEPSWPICPAHFPNG